MRMRVSRRAAVIPWVVIGLATLPGTGAAQRFEVTVSRAAHAGPLTGRLIVAVATREQMKGHSWHQYTWADMVRRIAAAVRASAPPGESTAGWSY